MKDNFEHILQDKLRDFSVKAGPRDWTAIERSLGLDVKVRKRVPLYRYAAAAAAAILAATGVIAWIGLRQHRASIQRTAQAAETGMMEIENHLPHRLADA